MKDIGKSNIESKILDDCKKMSDNNSYNDKVVDYDEKTINVIRYDNGNFLVHLPMM